MAVIMKVIYSESNKVLRNKYVVQNVSPFFIFDHSTYNRVHLGGFVSFLSVLR